MKMGGGDGLAHWRIWTGFGPGVIGALPWPDSQADEQFRQAWQVDPTRRARKGLHWASYCFVSRHWAKLGEGWASGPFLRTAWDLGLSHDRNGRGKEYVYGSSREDEACTSSKAWLNVGEKASHKTELRHAYTTHPQTQAHHIPPMGDIQHASSHMAEYT
ncbi:hypothetical protein NPX13_g10887 [Xylaria arbuscula]|uniref:Uncharacterized protein n=1 Tax=Xylaria arbuscula TaxID=114810 RepID=A0A9W8N3V8_9PEZI|nr:hypothetical protein NPX13_g10887 [Xylaria arbuscula]